MTKKLPQKKGSRSKLREYFFAHLGKVLRSDTLRKVAGTSEWARRVRELRNEEGMNIITHNDSSDLKMGEYVLVDKKIKPAFERGISKETRALILDRNGFTCQMCGSAAGESHPFDQGRKVRLHIGHVIDKSMGGTDEPSNLTLNRPQAIKLLAQVRRAPSSDQIDLLKWIVKKFPNQTIEILKKLKN